MVVCEIIEHWMGTMCTTFPVFDGQGLSKAIEQAIERLVLDRCN